MILHKIPRFLPGLLCFSSKSLYPASVTAAMFTLPKIKGLLECLQACQISHASKFIFKCFKPAISFVVQEWDPPTTAVHLQTSTLESSSA